MVTWPRVWIAALLGMVLASMAVYTQGQPPALMFGSVTTAAPSYTNATTNQLSMTTNGSLRTQATDTAGASVFSAAAAAADGMANPTAGGLLAFMMCRNAGGTWDMCRSASVLEDAAESSGVAGGINFGVRRNVAASSSGADGDYSTFNVDALGQLWVRSLSPCGGVATTTVPISVAADTAVITASASNRNYLCGGVLVANAAETVSIWEGTGTACGTGSTAIAGSTTEANGMSLSATGGFQIAQPIRGIGTNVDTCLRISGSNRITGYLSYVQAP